MSAFTTRATYRSFHPVHVLCSRGSRPVRPGSPEHLKELDGGRCEARTAAKPAVIRKAR